LQKTTPQQLVQFQQKHCSDILIIVPSTNIFLVSSFYSIIFSNADLHQMEEKREYLSKIDNEKAVPDSVTTSSIER
jgi:hypothetical protein